ncbi:hypothetical protein [Hymenobacter aerophilus]|uniref:hypothetical protein n=1 Tax=Hymenobacter aerophilus TaxID=119644 RepID=UPI0003775F16|nr:hypothetical protein [Hymenobacter aerophilus]
MKHATLLLAALLGLSQCKKKDAYPTRITPPPLPAETTTGARTFGCLVNGKPFTASGINRVHGDWLTLNTLGISADTKNSGEEATIGLLLTGILTDEKVYPLRPKDVGFPPSTLVGFVARYTGSGCDYDGSFTKKGILTLTRYDPVARIAAGRFAFTLYQPGCDTLRVTEGRFDVTF